MRFNEVYKSDFKLELEELRPEFAKAAQKSYNCWHQDEEGMDVELGSGGICQDIASNICGVLVKWRIDCFEQHAETDEQHVWAVAYDEMKEEAYEIDIHPSAYETGGGYDWKKIPDVVFDGDDIFIGRYDYKKVQYLKDTWSI